jgi:hypothetical protein
MQSESKTNPIEMQELLEDVNEVIKNGVNKIVYDILFKKLNDELNKCKAELQDLKKTYGKCDSKENIELKIEDESESAEVSKEAEPKYVEILKESEKIQNAQINKPKPKLVIVDDVPENSVAETQGLECENCDVEINPNKEGYQILCKENEEKVVCSECYTDFKEDFLEDGWTCDDASESESEESEESEDEESVADAAEEEEEVEEEEVEEEVEEEESEAPESSGGRLDEEESEAPESSGGRLEDEESEAPESSGEILDEEDEEEVFEIEIYDVSYFATNEENGPLYEVDEEGNPGNKIGYLKDGEPFFY